jgi:hypothetical protein
MDFKRKYIYIALIACGLLYIVWDAISQPGPEDLKGGFTETAFYRNEQNTGPIVRIYAVTVTDTLWNEMIQFGNYKPYNKYGTTRVYFFLAEKPAPTKIFPEGTNFEQEFQQNCVAKYEKDVMSQVSLVKFPFNDHGNSQTLTE